MNATSISCIFLPGLGDHYIQEPEEVDIGMETVFAGQTVPLHTRIHGAHDYNHNICTRSRQQKSVHDGWEIY